jgi:hypothetical protein
LHKVNFFKTNFVAEFLTSLSKFNESCDFRVKAAKLSPQNYQFVTSAAMALKTLGRDEEAQMWNEKVDYNFS